MTSPRGASAFTLSVEFAGICLYVIHPDREVVGVLMPTCDGRVDPKHEDGDTGARHVPYLLMDLANFDPKVAPGLVADGPQFQVVRRLRREEIFFEPQEPQRGIELDPDPLPLPDLSVYVDAISLKKNMLSANPPVDLDVRTTLVGGKLTATTIGGSGKGNGSHGRDWDKYEVDWAGSIKWTRKNIPGDSLTIQIRSLDNTAEVTPLTLRPVERARGELVIELKIAILCENNPLEWKEFEPRFEKDDVDSKWLFRLFEANDGGSLLKAIRRTKLPYPKLKPRDARTTGNTGCTGFMFQPSRSAFP
jgi:hypothetical protein